MSRDDARGARLGSGPEQRETKVDTRGVQQRPSKPLAVSTYIRDSLNNDSTKLEPAQQANEPPRTGQYESRSRSKNSQEALELSRLRTKIQVLEQELQSARDRYRNDLSRVLDQCEAALHDNAVLRSQIVNMKKAPGQVYDDSYYQRGLEELNEVTKGWVAGAFKSQGERSLSNAEELEIWQLLGQYSAGQLLRERLGKSDELQSINQYPQRRMAFVRHMISLFLSKHVFQPFCCGAPSDVNLMLKRVEISICVKGTTS